MTDTDGHLIILRRFDDTTELNGLGVSQIHIPIVSSQSKNTPHHVVSPSPYLMVWSVHHSIHLMDIRLIQQYHQDHIEWTVSLINQYTQ